ncbi:hypothetical protein [Pseudorhodoferax sp.]|jgi:hypothetical protein|uniref:hypothetical protein n=1 Tax=Pseudorhodoferax sp. TaxID=1993553 RepID=UPI001B53FB61|nr:hypothetical protein [Pseudorhodoferax sp.]MBP8145124.1 hypothetical protein [Inhella sp.]
MKPHTPPIGLLLAAVLLTSPGRGDAHGDEDHDAAPQRTASASALPRFAASSELFELVGVLDGRNLTLYLDHAASNAPVQAAELELELAGQTLKPQALPDGRFAVTLARPPGTGVHAVTVSVSAGDAADLLAAELDVHADPGEAAHEHADAGPGRARALGALLLVGALAALAGLGQRWRARRRRAAAAGASA